MRITVNQLEPSYLKKTEELQGSSSDPISDYEIYVAATEHHI